MYVYFYFRTQFLGIYVITKTTEKFWEKYEKFKKNFQDKFWQDDEIRVNIEVTNIDYYEDLATSEDVTDAKFDNKLVTEEIIEEKEQIPLERSEYDDVDEDAPEICYFEVVEDDDDFFYSYELFDSVFEWFYYVCLKFFKIHEYTDTNIGGFYSFLLLFLLFFFLVYDCISNIAVYTQYFNQRHAYQLVRNQPRRYNQLFSCIQETAFCTISFSCLYLTCFI